MKDFDRVKLCETSKGFPVFVGSRWREDDPRHEDRVVEVISYDKKTDRLEIKGPTGRITWAARKRFSVKGGYIEVAR